MNEKLNMDPMQLRLTNYAEKDQGADKPWSSKNLRLCYSPAADRFGWSKRSAKPGSIVEGNEFIGYGMATATYPARRSSCQAVVRILPEGRAFVGCGSQDLGTGTYTVEGMGSAEPAKVTSTMNFATSQSRLLLAEGGQGWRSAGAFTTTPSGHTLRSATDRPAPETWQHEIKTGYGQVESRVRFPLPHTLDGRYLNSKEAALN